MPSLLQARAERNEGMRRAVEHADRTDENWSGKAYDFLVEFAKVNEQFISEDVSDASKEMGLPQPPTDRAWGTVYRKAAKNEVITQVGTGRSRRRHASICPMWGSLVFKAEARAA
jgi:hypothetical protein